MNNVVKLREREPEWALETLNRETGLSFSRLPVSLLCDDTNACDVPKKITLRSAWTA